MVLGKSVAQGRGCPEDGSHDVLFLIDTTEVFGLYEGANPETCELKKH